MSLNYKLNDWWRERKRDKKPVAKSRTNRRNNDEKSLFVLSIVDKKNAKRREILFWKGDDASFMLYKASCYGSGPLGWSDVLALYLENKIGLIMIN